VGSRIRASDGKDFVLPLDRAGVLIEADPAGQLVKIKDWEGEKTEFDYDDGLGEDK
jgi:hypothetical protein